MQAFIWGSGAERLMRDFQTQVSQIVAENLRSLLGADATFSVPLPVAANFVASTLLMLIQWWFEEDMHHSPEEIDAMFQKLVMPSIHVLIVHEG